jgi:hypothetical protein
VSVFTFLFLSFRLLSLRVIPYYLCFILCSRSGLSLHEPSCPFWSSSFSPPFGWYSVLCSPALLYTNIFSHIYLLIYLFIVIASVRKFSGENSNPNLKSVLYFEHILSCSLRNEFVIIRLPDDWEQPTQAVDNIWQYFLPSILVCSRGSLNILTHPRESSLYPNWINKFHVQINISPRVTRIPA